MHIRSVGLPEPRREFLFWPGRRFKFDFAWPDAKLACEVEGGTFMAGGGRHQRAGGFETDAIKYSEAAIRGWAVIRVTGAMVKDGRAVALIERALAVLAGQAGQAAALHTKE